MEVVGRDLSTRLRDPEGEYKCDLIIALTHSRYVIPALNHRHFELSAEMRM
jgi:hypothetical protein